MTATRAIRDRCTGEVDCFVAGSSYDPGAIIWIGERHDPVPSALRVPIALIVLVLVLAIAAAVVGIVRDISQQPAALSLQSYNAGPRLAPPAGVVASTAGGLQ